MDQTAAATSSWLRSWSKIVAWAGRGNRMADYFRLIRASHQNLTPRDLIFVLAAKRFLNRHSSIATALHHTHIPTIIEEVWLAIRVYRRESLLSPSKYIVAANFREFSRRTRSSCDTISTRWLRAKYEPSTTRTGWPCFRPQREQGDHASFGHGPTSEVFAIWQTIGSQEMYVLDIIT